MSKIQSTTTLVEWHTAKAAARISGLSEDMINYLCRHSIVTPSHGKKRGRGTVREYTYADVLLLRLIAKLLTQGVSALKLKKCLAALQKRGSHTEDLISKKYVLTDGHNVYFGDSAAVEIMSSGQMVFAFVLDLDLLRREVNVKLPRRKAA
jgi:DNA-binding transcriptional MerR regulator